jgi:hypothetical protein
LKIDALNKHILHYTNKYFKNIKYMNYIHASVTLQTSGRHLYLTQNNHQMSTYVKQILADRKEDHSQSFSSQNCQN